ncbi:protein RFT1 homolog [Octopus bimaculoides]|uniref:Protein RFT1 homolog n=1 Tax=Octopus bimaculoides TaxID=37653 RepID=A0A0L8GMI3_OCTBM|nr:protein RFT1 homolog [Octopus bimaculoides]|eukprot:XP_014779942.1 PREDICTED: protein RFT1 homolog [Octopus bimaculoides]
MKASNLLSGAAKAASYNIILQLSTRILTFILNAFILHYISRDMLGVVNVRLTLLYSTGIFISREAFNRACLSHAGKTSWTQVINLLWLTVPCAAIASTVLGAIWLHLLQRPDPLIVPHYSIGVFAFAASTVIEVIAQPLWVITQAFMFVKLKVLMEGLLLIVKAAITMFLVIYKPHLGLIIFSLAQVVSMMVYVGAFYVFFIFYIQRRKENKDFPLKTFRDFFPKFLQNQPFINKDLTSLTWSFMKQSFLKQILTEGEKYVMTLFQVLSFADQGIYDIIHNLGSLAPRFLFCPIEESSYLFFSQLLFRGKTLKQQTKESARMAATVLRILLTGVTLIGLTILVFGYSYSFLALDMYGGPMLSSSLGPVLLRWYTVYVSIIAVNGVSESFVFAVMSKKEVDRYNNMMLIFSVSFLSASWIFTHYLGSIGFILANCLNMFLRILHSAMFIWKYFQNGSIQPLHALLIRPLILIGFSISFCFTFLSETLFCCDKGPVYRLVHVVIGATCLLANLLTVIILEKDSINFIWQQYKSQTKEPESKLDEKKTR